MYPIVYKDGKSHSESTVCLAQEHSATIALVRVQPQIEP